MKRLAVFLLTFLVSGSVHAAAIITLLNNDGPGEGLNDPSPPAHANQIGNNPGTTLGQLRANTVIAAMNVWAASLNSTVSIVVTTQFNALSCTQFSGTLGQAGTTGTAANFAGGATDIAYHIALAESLSGSNINAGASEITATFNSAVDTNNVNCLGGGGFYYGLDGNAPAGTVSLYQVVLHEMAHGLGFSALFNGATGAFTGLSGFPDAFSRNLMDLETGKSWDAMTNGERLASAINDPDLVWKGPLVNASRGVYLSPSPDVKINAPAGIAGLHPANFGGEPSIVLPPGGATGNMVDGDTLSIDPCSVSPDSATVTGKIILYALPPCNAAVPAFLAQLSNAAGMIISNTAASGLPNISGQLNNQVITMPYVGATLAVGNSLRANIGTANVTIQNSVTQVNGENQGKVRMNAPVVFSQGSSVSHWSPEARPDLLMEAAAGALAFGQVDLTLLALKDIGWNPIVGNPELIFKHGFENP